LKPASLDGRVIEPADRVNPRKELAAGMVKHPYFGEAAVNRIRSNLFGRGIVDPVDDFRSSNPPTHPELLNYLAAEFRAQRHDLRRLINTIVLSRTYQLTGTPSEGNREDRTNYSHANPRPLDAISFVFSTAISGSGTNNGKALRARAPSPFASRTCTTRGAWISTEAPIA
jgi:hypothetical protein